MSMRQSDLPNSGENVKVIRLLEYRCRDTVSILKVLLSLAMQGKLRGLIVCYRTEDGEEKTVFTGAYKAHPNKAVGSILRTSMRLMQANGELE
jgi:hypothetical protein